MDEIEYGLLGKKIGYSYSKLIYEFSGYNYELVEVSEEDLESFIKGKKYKGLNVTIPYKEKVIEFLDELSFVAKKCGVVNTIINDNGKLIGDNTDYYGFLFLLKEYGTLEELRNKSFLILGSGATSKTIRMVLNDNGINDVKVASSKDGFDYHYSELSDLHFDFVINATPVGTYPNISEKIDARGDNIIDVIYNPYKTRLELDNKFNASGLDMLIVQAIESMNRFNLIPKSFSDIKDYLNRNTRNIVLVGLPGSGKTTIGEVLSKKLKKDFFDTDKEIEKEEKIERIIKEKGEAYFREKETDIIKEVSLKHGAIISTGGGVVLKDENMKMLMANGIVFYIDREIDEIYATFTPHPLTKSKEDLITLYNIRNPLYNKYSDYVIKEKELEKTVDKIIELVDFK